MAVLPIEYHLLRPPSRLHPQTHPQTRCEPAYPDNVLLQQAS